MQELKKKLARNKINEVIQRLLELTKSSRKDLYKELLLINRIYEESKAQYREGIEDTSKLDIKNARIAKSLIEIIDLLESGKRRSRKNDFLNYKNISFLLMFLISLLFCINYFKKKDTITIEKVGVVPKPKDFKNTHPKINNDYRKLDSIPKIKDTINYKKAKNLQKQKAKKSLVKKQELQKNRPLKIQELKNNPLGYYEQVKGLGINKSFYNNEFKNSLFELQIGLSNSSQKSYYIKKITLQLLDYKKTIIKESLNKLFGKIAVEFKKIPSKKEIEEIAYKYNLSIDSEFEELFTFKANPPLDSILIESLSKEDLISSVRKARIGTGQSKILFTNYKLKSEVHPNTNSISVDTNIGLTPNELMGIGLEFNIVYPGKYSFKIIIEYGNNKVTSDPFDVFVKYK